MNRLKLTTFDVTGTLLKFRIPPAIQYVQVGEHFGVQTEPKAMVSNFRTNWLKMNAQHPNFGKNSGLGWVRWWHQLVCQTFQDSVHPNKIDSGTLAAIADDLLRSYETAENYKLYPGAEDILLTLQSRGIPIGIISNFDERLPLILDDMGLTKYFRFILTSYEAGFEKPNPGIFNYALRKFGNMTITPKHILHIGDKPDLDYIAARRMGWNAVLVHQEEPEDVLEQYPEIKPDSIFQNLKELQDHIQSLYQK
ncbi:rhythmically expressed gene 2 protein [Anabrus simplex]|uniref:rhythmically expressed gene 2 protein n=1 Tax=Anabrus simplex TaxID=316456 RepID=UPI0034DCD8E0